MIRSLRYICGTLFMLILYSGTGSTAETIPVPDWGTDKYVITKKLSASHVVYREFTPQSNPKYENKIMSYILAIDGTLENRISIVRTRTIPIRDYLMVKNRLYSILEDYGTISGSRTEEIVGKLTKIYGSPQLQKSPSKKIYSFTHRGTKVLMMVYRKARDMDCRVYYYSNRLFRMLIAE